MSDPLQYLSDTTLLGYVVGSKTEAARLLSHTGGSLAALLNETRAAYAAAEPAKARLYAMQELMRRGLAEPLRERSVLSAPAAVRDYLRAHFAGLEHEVFIALFLDAQNRLLVTEEMFRGTLTTTSVYPREVVKEALARNAAGVIFGHNHPSGVAEPSRADETLTQQLKLALALVDVRVLDHFVVAAASIMSFSERGIL